MLAAVIRPAKTLILQFRRAAMDAQGKVLTRCALQRRDELPVTTALYDLADVVLSALQPRRGH